MKIISSITLLILGFVFLRWVGVFVALILVVGLWIYEENNRQWAIKEYGSEEAAKKALNKFIGK